MDIPWTLSELLDKIIRRIEKSNKKSLPIDESKSRALLFGFAFEGWLKTTNELYYDENELRGVRDAMFRINEERYSSKAILASLYAIRSITLC